MIDPYNMPDRVMADLDRHQAESDRAQAAYDKAVADVWQELAAGNVTGLDMEQLALDLARDALAIAIYETFKDDQPPLAGHWYCPSCSFADFRASIEATVEQAAKDRVRDE